MNDEQTLNELIKAYYLDKTELDSYKKSVDEYNTEIKETMKELNLNEFTTDDGLTAKVTVQKRETFDEEKLIIKLTELQLGSAIDLKPVVNYDKLEDLIYNGKLDASVLSEFKQVKEIPTLKVSMKKGE